MTAQILELAVDKFSFRFPTDLFYSEAGLWVRFEGRRVRVGLSDFTQQRNGDIAFAEIKNVGTAVRSGEEMGVIETIKINLSLPSPVCGTIVGVNRDLETSPEVINLDPYGKGWLAAIEVVDCDAARGSLRTAQEYMGLARAQAEAEVLR